MGLRQHRGAAGADAAQQQLNSADLTGDPNPDKKLTELALGFANRSRRQRPVRRDHHLRWPDDHGRRRSPASIPDTLRDQVAGQRRPADDPDRGRLP